MSSATGRSRGEGRRAFSNRKRRDNFRNPNVRQEKSPRLVTEIVGLTRVLSERIGEHA
jgi:hypothetical protein